MRGQEGFPSAHGRGATKIGHCTVMQAPYGVTGNCEEEVGPFMLKVLILTNNPQAAPIDGAEYYEAYYSLGDRNTYPEMRRYRKFKDLSIMNGKIGLHAIINLADNTHKDWVFSMRYIERGSSDFIIESETRDRDIRNSPIIRPGYGGWIKWQNGVPVISRSDEKDNMGQADLAVFNVQRRTNPVGNEEVSAKTSNIKVIGGVGSVTVWNAAGKKVVISNMLGQTIASTTLSSDKAEIPASAGVIVVAVEGESAVKVLVK